MASNDLSLYEKINGHEGLKKVHKTFYDKIYAHPWIGRFFEGLDQGYIENQQTAFMSGLMGGPKTYQGKPVRYAHQHMFIPEALFELRQDLLRESLQEAEYEQALISAWLDLDSKFKHVIVKNSIEDCKKFYTHRQIVAYSANGRVE